MSYAAGLLVVVVGSGVLASQPPPRTLTFEDRVRAQGAIERVYYSHQIGTTIPFEQAVPRAVLESKVRKYLDQTAALEVYWKTVVTDAMLQRELERMAHGTKMPERLEELYGSLGNDPFLIKECLARASLVDRLAHNFYALDPTIHAEARRRAEGLHRQLASGELSATVEHPSRSLIKVTMSDSEADQLATIRHQTFEERLSPDAFRERRARFPESAGQISAVKEEPDAFEFSVVLGATSRELRVANYVIPKTGWDEWWVVAEQTIQGETTAPVAFDRGPLPVPASARSLSAVPCTPDDTWANGIIDDEPELATRSSMVWTGSEMIVWGPATGGILGFGRRYDPATDTWTRTSIVNAPSGRTDHTAVWTGTSMIVWGGSGRTPQGDDQFFNDGGRYDPTTDSWSPTSRVGAPSARSRHSAVFTGDSMVVWGGVDSGGSVLGTGGRYDPVADTWLGTATADAPSGRSGHSAVWTGTSMVVWGGERETGWLGTGGKYDPATDTWTATSNVGAPCGRRSHTAIWTGSSMVVWGGQSCGDTRGSNDGGRYDPAADTWTATSTTGAPPLRYNHTAIWTGDSMVVWGGTGLDLVHGSGVDLKTGGRYDPSTNAWTPTTTTGAPSARNRHSAVWAASLMIVWDGSQADDTGGRYDPRTDSWTPTALPAMVGPSPRSSHTAVWTGSAMVVWGGVRSTGWPKAGGRYDPATDNWTPTSTTGAPAERHLHTAVWTGGRMVIWGGHAGSTGITNTGGSYDPTSDTWTPMSVAGAPTVRVYHTAVWTGSLMLVWGGDQNSNGVPANDGGRYDPASDAWSLMSTTGAPFTATDGHTAVWAGNVMVVWGGRLGSALDIGGRYDPVNDTWAPTTTTGAPSARAGHSAVWTGDSMIVWGGRGDNNTIDTGGRYDPVSDGWTPTSATNAPAARSQHTAVWTGNAMVVWGGVGVGGHLSTGSRYESVTDSWTATSTVGAPSGRREHTAVWAGNEMIIWGGIAYHYDVNTGGQYFLGATMDNDGDGFSECQGDCRDTNPAIHPGATEACNGFDDNCDGLVDEDASGVDSDNDSIHNACDNCAFDWNRTQTDFNRDGQGDLCDVNDGLIYVFSSDKSRREWQAESGYTSWNSYRGSLSVLRATGQYTQVAGSNPLAAHDCGVAESYVFDNVRPRPGAVAFNLVTGVSGGVESSLGTNSAGVPRPNTNPCP